MRTRAGSRFETEQHDDEVVRPYMEQLMNGQDYSQAETHDGQSNELRITDTEEQQNDESGKTIAVQFNSRNQAIKKDGRKLASFLGFVARTPELTPLHIHDWRSFDKDEKKKLVEFVRKKFSIPTRGEEFVIKSIGKKWKDYKCDLKSVYLTKFKTKDVLLKNKPNRIPRDQWTGLVSYWVSEKAKRRSQTNRNNRAKQKMPHTGGSKSIATLMDEKAENGVEPTRAQVFILTHRPRKDGRPLDEESSKTIDMINEKLSNSEGSNEQPPCSVAWEGDVYSQVLGNEKTGYVRGLGLGPTPSVLWCSRSFGNNVEEDSSNEIVKRLEQEVTKLKDINGKQNEELSLVKQNQEKLLSELAWVRKAMSRNAPNELSIHQNINEISDDQVPDANSGHERGQQSPHMLFKGQSVAENIPSSHGHTT
ncbi:uncharacterized protein LOC132060304 isoform X2 [Lycium ferocissimum]|uniref:uncharacterized protein LOC132060304 isoform X2 n=1 Tax=Lycium ferocissimum TaxID=112874 RepID=UPI0028157216|nr:uncharacterized protein LOC132060304 isoform X2 [Lycium ferocissimum]